MEVVQVTKEYGNILKKGRQLFRSSFALRNHNVPFIVDHE